jgi:hypothetical protein
VTCMGMFGGGLWRIIEGAGAGLPVVELLRSIVGSRVMACIADELDPTAPGADSVLIRYPNEVAAGEAGRDDRLGDETLAARVGEPDCRSKLA